MQTAPALPNLKGAFSQLLFLDLPTGAISMENPDLPPEGSPAAFMCKKEGIRVIECCAKWAVDQGTPHGFPIRGKMAKKPVGKPQVRTDSQR